MFTITFLTEKERNQLVYKHGLEHGSIEFVYTPENYPVKALRKYLDGDEYGVYKKDGVKIPFYLKHAYKVAKEKRERRIYMKFLHLDLSTKIYKTKYYYISYYNGVNISKDDIMQMRNLLNKG